MGEKELLTVKQVAEREQVTERTVRNWIAKGAVKVDPHHPGGGIRVVEWRKTDAVFFGRS